MPDSSLPAAQAAAERIRDRLREHPVHASQLEFHLTASIGIVLNSIEATMQTESLLQQSQKLAGELQSQQSELQQTNEQLERISVDGTVSEAQGYLFSRPVPAAEIEALALRTWSPEGAAGLR